MRKYYVQFDWGQKRLGFALAKSAEVKQDFVKGGTLKLRWSDCGAAHGKVTGLSPHTLTLGAKTTVTGSGRVREAVSGGTFEIDFLAAAWPFSISGTYTGDICKAKTFDMPQGLGTVTWDGLKCPVAAGAVNVGTDIQLSQYFLQATPAATISIKVNASNGDGLLCMMIGTKRAEETIVV